MGVFRAIAETLVPERKAARLVRELIIDRNVNAAAQLDSLVDGQKELPLIYTHRLLEAGSKEAQRIATNSYGRDMGMYSLAMALKGRLDTAAAGVRERAEEIGEAPRSSYSTQDAFHDAMGVSARARRARRNDSHLRY